MYTQSAEIYDALNSRRDYGLASDAVARLVGQFAPRASTLLDVGCGTGRHLEHLRGRFDAEGVDVSSAMLEVARRRCPDLPLHRASFLDFRLNRQFDVVTCLFGSIAYAVSVRNLNRAVRSLARHLRPGGVLVVEPWVSERRFRVNRLVFDFVDEPSVRAARIYRTRRHRRTAILDIHYLTATPAEIAGFTEEHRLGLFSRADYLRAFRDAGLVIRTTSADFFGYGVYAGSLRPLSRTDMSRRRFS